MIEVKIVLDSVNPSGSRLTTWLLTYPRMIHSEIMTHRIFSRNAASSRAIPITKMLEAIEGNPAWPEYWGSKKAGMQAGEPLSTGDQASAMGQLDALRIEAIERVAEAEFCGLHKQIANRYLEPWSHITVLATATDHRNFFKLRAHPAAQPEFQVIAYRMLDAYLNSIPSQLEWGQWHLPGVIQDGPDVENLLKMATALAARASYSAFEEGLSLDRAIAIHDKLAESGHWSPFEHCAQACESQRYPWSNFDNPRWHKDSLPHYPIIDGISHWMQYRKRFRQENATEVNLMSIFDTKPSWISL